MCMGHSIICPHCFLKDNYFISQYTSEERENEPIPRTILISDDHKATVECSSCSMVFPWADERGIRKVFDKLKEDNVANEDFDSYCTELALNPMNNFSMRRAAVFFIKDSQKLQSLTSLLNLAIIENASLQLDKFSELKNREYEISCPFCLRDEIFTNDNKINTYLTSINNKNINFSIFVPFRNDFIVCPKCNRKITYKMLVETSLFIEQAGIKHLNLAELPSYCFLLIENYIKKIDSYLSLPLNEAMLLKDEEFDIGDEISYYSTKNIAFLYIFDLDKLENLFPRVTVNGKQWDEHYNYIKSKKSLV